MRYALCAMRYAFCLCVMRYALCVVRYALCVLLMRYALCAMRYALCVMRYVFMRYAGVLIFRNQGILGPGYQVTENRALIIDSITPLTHVHVH